MNDMRQMTALGRSIEDNSFAIIDAEAGDHGYGADEWQVVRRVIHATADFEMQHLVRLSDDAVASGIAALRRGAPVIVDVKMIAVGLNEDRLKAYGSSIHCFISDPDVIEGAKAAETRQRRIAKAIEALTS